jgi:hypothetical protein
VCNGVERAVGEAGVVQRQLRQLPAAYNSVHWKGGGWEARGNKSGSDDGRATGLKFTDPIVSAEHINAKANDIFCRSVPDPDSR